GGCDAWAQGGEGVARFAARRVVAPGPRGYVAYAGVVQNGVAENIARRVGFFDVGAVGANHNRQFVLVIPLLGVGWESNLVVVTNQRGGRLEERNLYVLRPFFFWETPF